MNNKVTSPKALIKSLRFVFIYYGRLKYPMIMYSSTDSYETKLTLAIICVKVSLTVQVRIVKKIELGFPSDYKQRFCY